MSDAGSLDIVVPATAGTRWRASEDVGFPPARERQEYCGGCHISAIINTLAWRWELQAFTPHCGRHSSDGC